MIEGNMRDYWQISVPKSVLIDAVRDRLACRFDRAQFWQKARDDAKAELKTNGLVVNEAFDSFGNATVAYNVPLIAGVQARVDDSKVRAYNEACTKYQEHKRAYEDYVKWQSFLELLDDQHKCILRKEDYDYFFNDW